MKQVPQSQSGIFAPRVIGAFFLCSAGVFLAMFGFAATPPGGTTGLATKLANESLLLNRAALPPGSSAKTRPAPSLAQSIVSGWSIFTSPNNTSGDSAHSYNGLGSVTCTSISDCWAGSNFHWDGISWSIVSSPAGGRVTCVSTSDCWSVGSTINGQALIQHWDGNAWTIIDSPSPSSGESQSLFDVTCVSASECWAVGSYYYGQSYAQRSLIEHWDGNAWTIDSSQIDGAQLIGVVCVAAADCWAAGTHGGFQTLIEHWDGSAWTIVASPNSPLSNGDDRLLDVTCTSASNCWAVGFFHNGQVLAYQTLIEHWDGNAWTIVSSPNAGGYFADELANVTCVTASDCWAVGNYVGGSSGSTEQTLIEHWDGTSWLIATSPNTSVTQENYLGGVTCSSASACWAVGHYINNGDTYGTYQTLIEHWDGNSWSIFGSPNSATTTTNELFGLACTSASQCWSVGHYVDINQFPLIEEWNGNSWTVVSSQPSVAGTYHLNAVACASASDCWAVGDDAYFDGQRNVADAFVEHWDGTSWNSSHLPGANYQNFLNSVTCVSASNCWAVGYSTANNDDSNTPRLTLTEHWDGNSWMVVPSPNVISAQNSVLRSVSCTSSANCWAVGNDRTGSNSHTLTEHWNGNTWAIVVSPSLSETLNLLSGVVCISAMDCFVVGYAGGDGNPYHTLIERWQGNAWSIVPSANFSNQDNLLIGVSCASSADCWAVGNYVAGNGKAQTLIERWNGSTWSIASSANTGSIQDNKLNAVSCRPNADCWAIGSYTNFYNFYGVPQTLTEHYLPPIQLLGAVSSKAHGAAGTFNIDLPFSGNAGLECRTGGVSGNHQMIAAFSVPVAITNATVISGVGNVSGATVSGSQVTVNLTGVPSGQTIVVKFAGVSDGTNTTNVDIPMRLLFGDTTGDGIVNASDTSQIKLQSGQPVSSSTFRADVTANGVINSSDLAAVKAVAGTAFP